MIDTQTPKQVRDYVCVLCGHGWTASVELHNGASLWCPECSSNYTIKVSPTREADEVDKWDK
jgi:DNA-directed RNA polymerase subunit RPC12/RpoP